MSIQYRITKADDKILPKMWTENWQLIAISDWKFYFSKKSVDKKAQNPQETSQEFLIFRSLYKKLKQNWLYDPKLHIKFEEKRKEYWLEVIMKNLDQYIKHCQVQNKPEDKILMPTTYLNQNRFLDNWALVNTVTSIKWINDIFEERGFSKELIDNIMQEVKAWEVKQKKEITVWVLNNIIDYVLNK